MLWCCVLRNKERQTTSILVTKKITLFWLRCNRIVTQRAEEEEAINKAEGEAAQAEAGEETVTKIGEFVTFATSLDTCVTRVSK